MKGFVAIMKISLKGCFGRNLFLRADVQASESNRDKARGNRDRAFHI
jgi:hypothetical protein